MIRSRPLTFTSLGSLSSLLASIALGTLGCSSLPHPSRSAARVIPREPAGETMPPFSNSSWWTISEEKLTRDFDRVWAMSDVHGQLTRCLSLLKSAQLVSVASRESTSKELALWERVRWKPRDGKRHLLVILGDHIGKHGEDPAALILLFQKLEREALAQGSRLVVTLGNHEAEFLADPNDEAEPELIAGATRYAGKIRGIHRGEDPNGQEILESELGDELKRNPLGAVIGKTLWVHSGFFDVPLGDEPAAWVRSLTRLHAGQSYDELTGDKGAGFASALDRHDWIEKPELRNKMRRTLRSLGLEGVAMGHEPRALGVTGQIALSKDGAFLKLDAGMNAYHDHGTGRILSCPTKDFLFKNCVQLDSKGKTSPLAPEKSTE